MTKKYRITTVASLLTSMMLLFPATGTSKDSKEEKEPEALKKSRETYYPTSFFGGMILTKIELEDRLSLVPFAYKDDEDYAQKSEDLIGLVVFNTKRTEASMPKGIYIWDGECWQYMPFSNLRAYKR